MATLVVVSIKMCSAYMMNNIEDLGLQHYNADPGPDGSNLLDDSWLRDTSRLVEDVDPDLLLINIPYNATDPTPLRPNSFWIAKMAKERCLTGKAVMIVDDYSSQRWNDSHIQDLECVSDSAAGQDVEVT